MEKTRVCQDIIPGFSRRFSLRIVIWLDVGPWDCGEDNKVGGLVGR